MACSETVRRELFPSPRRRARRRLALRRRRPWNRPAISLFLQALVLELVFFAFPILAAPPPAERFPVGAIVHGSEVAVFEVLKEAEQYLIPLEPFLQICGCHLESSASDGYLRLTTPLGTVDLEDQDIRHIDGEKWIEERFLEDVLATPVVFDPLEQALRFDLPWIPGSERSRDIRAPLTPEIKPASRSLSGIHVDLSLLSNDGEVSAASASRFEGRLGDGWWRLRYQDDLDGDRRFQEYAWLRRLGEGRLLQVGHQRVRLHPLLSGVEMTGLQFARTNQPLRLFSRRLEPGELLPRHATPLTSFRGPAPPAGLAELWVDDTLVARQIIGLDGHYEFLDVTLPTRQARIEVRLFERHNLDVPAQIHEEILHLSSYLLAPGARVRLAGVGWAGNPLTEADGGGEVSGFVQMRRAFGPRLTLETVAQRQQGRLQALGGLVAGLGHGLVMSFAVGAAETRADPRGVGEIPGSQPGSSGAAFGYELDLQGQLGAFDLIGRSRWEEAGFRAHNGADPDAAIFDHFLELGYRASSRWRLGLIGRSRDDGGRRTDYLLPTFAWRPSPGLSLRGRPSSEGDYRFDLRARLGRFGQAAVSIQRRTFTTFTMPVGRASRLMLGADFGGGQAERFSAIWSRAGSGRLRPAWSAGPLFSHGEIGFRATASLALAGGLLVQIDLEDDPLLRVENGRGLRAHAALAVDLAVAGRRLMPSRRAPVQEDRGAVAGRVRIDSPVELGDSGLGGIPILLDGQPRGYTESDGGFVLPALEPGIYSVTLDVENLPIELTPVKSTWVVEVSRASVTRVGFTVRPEFGLAGRLRDAFGVPRAGVEVEAVKDDGTIVRRAVSDRFGLYRLDRLPIGTYLLRVVPDEQVEGAETVQRIVEIRDGFLFDQNLEPAPPD